MILKKTTVTIEDKDKQIEVLDISETAKQIVDRIFDDQITAKNLDDEKTMKYLVVENLLKDESFRKAITKTFRNLKRELNNRFITRIGESHGKN